MKPSPPPLPPGLDDLFSELQNIKQQLHSLTSQVDAFAESFTNILPRPTSPYWCAEQELPLNLCSEINSNSLPLDLSNYSTESPVFEDHLEASSDPNVFQLKTVPEIITIDDDGDDSPPEPSVSQPESQMAIESPGVSAKRASSETDENQEKKCRLELNDPDQSGEKYSADLEQVDHYPSSIDLGTDSDEPNDDSNSSIKSTSPISNRTSESPHASPKSNRQYSSKPKLSTKKIQLMPTLRNFEEHIKTITLDCPFEGCHESFEVEFDLSGHMIRNHGQKLFKCPVKRCEEMYNYRKPLKWHCFTHFPNFICRHCDDRYKTHIHLMSHIKECHTRGHFGCIKEANCSFIGRYRIDVIRHIQTVHKKASLSLVKFKIIEMKCPKETCDERFTEEEMDQYYEHMFHHHGINPNRCLVKNCSRSYPTEQELTSHISTRHANLTDWQCSHCPQKESTYSYLKRHIFNVHYEGLFQCSKEKCDFRSRFRSTVISHFNQEH